MSDAVCVARGELVKALGLYRISADHPRDWDADRAATIEQKITALEQAVARQAVATWSAAMTTIEEVA